MYQNNNKGRIESFKVAAAGLFHALSYHKNFQIQLVIGLLVLLGAAFFEFSRLEWVIVLIIVALVLTLELLNTVFEIVVDLAVKEELLPEAKLAKDVSAGAVLLMSIFASIAGTLLFLPHIWNLFY